MTTTPIYATLVASWGLRQSRPMIDHVSGPRVECWVRDTAPPGLKTVLDGIISRLHDEVERGTIAAVDINVWGHRIRCPPEGETAESDWTANDIWATYRAFETWAASNGYSLSPAFRRHQQQTLVSTESCEVIELPLVCLAVYDERELAAVFPCSTDQRTWSVGEGLDWLEQAASDPPSAEAGSKEIHS